MPAQFVTAPPTLPGFDNDLPDRASRPLGSKRLALLSPGLLRMTLATLVVISHFTKASFGIAAVDLFFVLSGYWIYRMYETKYAASRKPALLFLASRFMRVLPIFWLFNGLAIGLHYAFQDQVFAAQNLIGIFPNVFIVGYASLPQIPLVPAWSLDVEMQFYLVFPALYIALNAVGKYASVLVAGALVASGVCACAVPERVHTVLPFLGLFMLGGWSARSRWQPPETLVLAGALLCLGVLSCFLLLPTLRGFAIHDLDAQKFSWNAALNFGVTLSLAPAFLFSVYNKSSNSDRLLGDTSYVLYCSHWIAVLLAAHYLAGLSHVVKAPIVLALLLATYLVSIFLTLTVDRPIGRWREAWVSRNMHARTRQRGMRV